MNDVLLVSVTCMFFFLLDQLAELLIKHSYTLAFQLGIGALLVCRVLLVITGTSTSILLRWSWWFVFHSNSGLPLTCRVLPGSTCLCVLVCFISS